MAGKGVSLVSKLSWLYRMIHLYMLDKDSIWEFEKLINEAKKILVLQPDVPQIDPDSLRSALALGGILEELGKEVVYYLSAELPKVFQIIPGSDKFTQEFPENYDVSILVDCGSVAGQLPQTLPRFTNPERKQPFVIVDHHANRVETPFETLDVINPEAVSVGEVIYEIAKELGWPIGAEVAEHLIWSMMEDSSLEGSEFLALSENYETLVAVGELAKISKISVKDFFMKDEEARSLPFVLFNEKRKMLDRIEFYNGNRVALLFVTKEEEKIFKEAGLDSPGYMVRPEIRKIREVELTVVMTATEDRKYRGSARSKVTKAAVELARHFEGGGHDTAAGFVIEGRGEDQVRSEIVAECAKIIP